MRVLCIKSDGTVVHADRLARQLAPLPPGIDFTDYVVDAMGFVWLEALGVGCRVRLRPEKVTPQAEAALYFFLHDRRPQRVLVAFAREGSCQHKFYSPGTEAPQDIMRVMAAERRKRIRRFASRPADLGTLQSMPPLQRLLELYRNSQSTTFDLSRWRELLSSAVQGRFLIVERLDRDDVLLIRAVGSGYRAFDATWTTRSSGTRLEEQPDVDYGAWLASTYLAVLGTREAKTDVVDAIIFKPQFGRRRFGYRRLMLPFSGPGGRQLLLSASMPDPSVDLGVHQAVEAS